FFRLISHQGKWDAVISATGAVGTGAFEDLESKDWMVGFRSKLLGQILVAKHSVKILRDGGSITLTTGITAEEPVIHGVPKTTVNRAIEGFVNSVALELPRGIRINAVSPGLLEASARIIGKDFP